MNQHIRLNTLKELNKYSKPAGIKRLLFIFTMIADLQIMGVSAYGSYGGGGEEGLRSSLSSVSLFWTIRKYNKKNITHLPLPQIGSTRKAL